MTCQHSHKARGRRSREPHSLIEFMPKNARKSLRGRSPPPRAKHRQAEGLSKKSGTRPGKLISLQIFVSTYKCLVIYLCKQFLSAALAARVARQPRTPDNPHKCLMPCWTFLGSFWVQNSGAGWTKWPVGPMLVNSMYGQGVRQ